VDGYSHHEQKKWDLQVSKKKGWVIQGGQGEAKMEARDGLAERTSLLYIYSIYVVCVHVVSYTLFASNSALCLGYK
jgi:hypothetical protein